MSGNRSIQRPEREYLIAATEPVLLVCKTKSAVPVLKNTGLDHMSRQVKKSAKSRNSMGREV